jgi:DNA invertase Pin-like site-specific DNA recombinase
MGTTTPAGKAMYQMLAVFGEFERSIIQERVRAGVGRAKSEGKHCGRPWTAAKIEDAILADLRAPGRTEGVRKVAARHGVSVGTVMRISRPFGGASAAAAA